MYFIVNKILYFHKFHLNVVFQSPIFIWNLTPGYLGSSCRFVRIMTASGHLVYLVSISASGADLSTHLSVVLSQSK